MRRFRNRGTCGSTMSKPSGCGLLRTYEIQAVARRVSARQEGPAAAAAAAEIHKPLHLCQLKLPTIGDYEPWTYNATRA